MQVQGSVDRALAHADDLVVCHFFAIRCRVDDPAWEGRECPNLLIGHCAKFLKAAMINAGILPEDELETYGGAGIRLPMPGMVGYTHRMEISGGALGHGLEFPLV